MYHEICSVSIDFVLTLLTIPISVDTFEVFLLTFYRNLCSVFRCFESIH